MLKPIPSPLAKPDAPTLMSIIFENADTELLRTYLAFMRDNEADRDKVTIDTPNSEGLTPLHIAVGRNNLEMVKALVEAGAAFVPDNEGRMPSVIAAEMEVSEELADYIVEAESRAL